MVPQSRGRRPRGRVPHEARPEEVLELGGDPRGVLAVAIADAAVASGGRRRRQARDRRLRVLHDPEQRRHRLQVRVGRGPRHELDRQRSGSPDVEGGSGASCRLDGLGRHPVRTPDWVSVVSQVKERRGSSSRGRRSRRSRGERGKGSFAVAAQAAPLPPRPGPLLPGARLAAAAAAAAAPSFAARAAASPPPRAEHDP